MIKGAIFDMDGLMFDTERLANTIWLEVSRAMSFPLTLEQCLMFKGANNEYKRNLFKKWYGDSVNYDKAQELRDTLMHNYIKENGVPIKEGLFNLLNALKEKNIKMAVATSTSRNKAIELLTSANIYQYFEAEVYGNEVSKSKPDPEIFSKAINKLGFESKDCIILEDSPNGVQAARNANGIVIMIPDTIKPSEKEIANADYIFNNLNEVIKLL